MDKPNIVLFNPDQFRYDVMGHMGNPAAITPNLDRCVREDGVSFNHAFCQNPVCTPSRCSFMTGWYPHTRGHRTMFYMLRPDEPMLLKRLKDDGYTVWWGGKSDLISGNADLSQYCDEYHRPQKPPLPLWTIDQAKRWRGEKGSDTYFSFYVGKQEIPAGADHYHDIDWEWVLGAVEFIKRAPKDKPFCIYLPIVYPHPPYGVEDPWYSVIDRSRVPSRIPSPARWDQKPSILKGIAQGQNLQGWSEDRWTELRATYYGMCARVDYQFGLVMDALREAGSYDDTAVFFFADHGDFTGDYGLVEKTQNTFEDCLTRVPFVIKPPKNFKVQPRVSEALVELIDMPATVEAMAGLPPTHTHFGKSLVNVLSGEIDMHRDAVFCEGGRLHGERQAMELESNLIDPQGELSLYYPRIILQHGEGPEHTKAVMLRTKDYKYVRRFYEEDELYDLKVDPGEQNNLIHQPGMEGILSTLKERLLSFYIETCDTVPFDIDKRF